MIQDQRDSTLTVDPPGIEWVLDPTGAMALAVNVPGLAF